MTQEPVRNGLDRLVRSFPSKVRGFSVGLVANAASVAADGRAAWDVLRAADVRLTCVLAPEHGPRLQHEAGQRYGGYRDEELGLEVRSLYASQRELGSAAFQGLDLVVFDLPQVGCRFYTYLDTLARVLRYSHESGLPVMLLDRPNPIRADVVEGAVSEPGFESSFAPDQMPVRYGLTFAEFARWYCARNGLQPRLNIVLMEGYGRRMWFDETGLPWSSPSPNMRDLTTATLYPGTCLVEGTTLSEGRGTELPFQQFGAPWLNAAELLVRVRGMEFPGLAVESATFTPASSKHEGHLCRGLRLRVLDRDKLRPFAATVSLLWVIHEMHPDEELWTRDLRTGRPFVDNLLGESETRRCIEEGGSLEGLFYRQEQAAARFAEDRRPYVAYPDDPTQVAPGARLW